MTVARPTISVVVASHNARASITACLESLAKQVGGEAVEVLVVDNSTDGTAALVRERLGSVTFIAQPRAVLIPQLWATGIRASTGEIVALTTAHCVPGPDWVHEIVCAHRPPGVAVGGAIESDPRSSLIDWAVYFCRYSAHMLPFRAGPVDDIAADNASYRRSDIDACAEVWQDGFWEPAVHTRLRQAGVELRHSPSVVVWHRRSFDVAAFIKQRFTHGRSFGTWRAANIAEFSRGFRVLATPVVPIVLLARIVRRVNAKRRHRARLVAALPVVVLFLTAWALGELVGLVRGR